MIWSDSKKNGGEAICKNDTLAADIPHTVIVDESR